jgi:hypothetical protein
VFEDNPIGAFFFRLECMEGGVFFCKDFDYCSVVIKGFGLNSNLIVS